MKSLIIIFLTSLLVFSVNVFACPGSQKNPNCHCATAKHTTKHESNEKK